VVSFHKRPRSSPDEWDKTIIAFAPYTLKNLMLTPTQGQEPVQPESIEEQNFKIRLAHSHDRVNSASLLIQHMYMKRGYDVAGIQKVADKITLMVSQNEAVVGTLTLGIDSGQGLEADKNYHQEVEQLRSDGRKIFELTKFAVDEMRGSKRVLAGLFHVAYIYGTHLHKRSDAVIEVTPKHAVFYKRLLGFKQFGEARMNSRVNTVGVALRLDMKYMGEQIAIWGGESETPAGQKERSLYPYFFSKEDEAGITRRLLGGS
jgi:hypothetical protein